jgi:DNA-binding PadR family transcriptional regulator
MHAKWDHEWSRRERWNRPFGSGHRKDAWAEMWAEWWRGPAPRCERGLVRYLVLDAIASQPRHGYEIIQHIGDKSGGAYRPSPGVVYPTLQMLEELGHARTTARDDRKVYVVTEEGRREWAAHSDEVAAFYEGHAEQPGDRQADMALLMTRVGRLVVRFKLAWRRGSIHPATMRKIRRVLDDSLSELERLLAGEDL